MTSCLQGHVHSILLEHVRTASTNEIQALLCDVDDGKVALPASCKVASGGCTCLAATQNEASQSRHAQCEHHDVQGLSADDLGTFQEYFNLNGSDNGIAVPIAQLVQAPQGADRCDVVDDDWYKQVAFRIYGFEGSTASAGTGLHTHHQSCVW